jgi:hypothetical protein
VTRLRTHPSTRGQFSGDADTRFADPPIPVVALAKKKRGLIIPGRHIGSFTTDYATSASTAGRTKCGGLLVDRCAEVGADRDHWASRPALVSV